MVRKLDPPRARTSQGHALKAEVHFQHGLRLSVVDLIRPSGVERAPEDHNAGAVVLYDGGYSVPALDDT